MTDYKSRGAGTPSKPHKTSWYHSKKQWKKKRDAYCKYLRTAKWRSKRRKILDRCNAGPKSSIGDCERCGERKRLEVHHLTYDRIFKERMTDLMGVCIPCHRILDAERRFNKRLEMLS